MDFNKLVNDWLAESQMEECRNDYIVMIKEEREEKESANADALLLCKSESKWRAFQKRNAFFVIKENLKKGGLI